MEKQAVSKIEDLVKRLELTTQRLEALGTQKPTLAPKPTSAGSTGSEMASALVQYDEIVGEPISTFLNECNKIGGEIGEIANTVKAAFDEHRNFLCDAFGQPEPGTEAIQKLLEPTKKKIDDITTLKGTKKSTKYFNHYSALSEGLPALYWIVVKPKPQPYVKDMFDAAMFYLNRIRTENKGDKLHADWVTAWCEIFNSLQKYIRQFHTTGLIWNSSPGSGSGSGSKTSQGSKGPPQAPPPPPPGLLADIKKDGAGSSSSDRQALFAELNKGEAVTSGLKKVTSDMQTHKNPNLRLGSSVPADVSKKSSDAPAQAKNVAAVKPPKIYLKDDKVWNVEYQKDNRNITLDTDKKQAVYVYNCENSVVQIKGKVNSVTVDLCKKTSVVFDSLLAQVEIINSKSIEVQTLGAMPTVSIQKTDGCQVYLSRDSLNVEIITSKSSEMNVLVPQEDGEMIEYPIPEQFKTVFSQSNKKLETTVSDII